MFHYSNAWSYQTIFDLRSYPNIMDSWLKVSCWNMTMLNPTPNTQKLKSVCLILTYPIFAWPSHTQSLLDSHIPNLCQMKNKTSKECNILRHTHMPASTCKAIYLHIQQALKKSLTHTYCQIQWQSNEELQSFHLYPDSKNKHNINDKSLNFLTLFFHMFRLIFKLMYKYVYKHRWHILCFWRMLQK